MLQLDVFLLLLRIFLVVMLYVFLAQVFSAVVRDLRRADRVSAQVGGTRALNEKPTSGQLVVIDGGATSLRPGQRFSLEEITTIGRSPTNDIVLNDTFVSTEHAQVFYRGKQWWMEDMNSKNGTLLNSQPLTKPVPAKMGDVIQIGQIKLKLNV